MPARASVPIRNVPNVIGMYFLSPPMSFFMSKLWHGVADRARRRGTGRP